MNHFQTILAEAAKTHNLRRIPQESEHQLVDLSSNDYLGIASDRRLLDEFLGHCAPEDIHLSASASRLLSNRQKDYQHLENLLADLYGKSALLFNSGYHANTGIISAVCDSRTLILADKLVHASIIDGIILSRAKFLRYRHNDLQQLASLLEKNTGRFDRILVIAESVYSMDGDLCDLNGLAELKKAYGNVLLYVDEAHGFGAKGRYGLGLSEESGTIGETDILIGTFGKAAASFGAFAITNRTLKDFLTNKARSFIFSTALPPFSCLWSNFVVKKITEMDDKRKHLAAVSEFLNRNFEPLNGNIRSHSQIVPLITGDSAKAICLSAKLRELGYQALPIRTPTVPQGTERIRFSLNSNISFDIAEKLLTDIRKIL